MEVGMNQIDEAEVLPATMDDGALDPEGRRRLRRPRRILVSPIVLVALVLLVPAVWLAFQGILKVSEPHEFAKFSGSGSYYSLPGEQGERYMFGLNDGPLPDVTMTAARTILSEDSVAAAITLSVCRANPGQGDGSSGVGVGVGDLSEYCSEVIPVEGQNLGLLGQNDSLVATVVPLVDGSIHVTGFDLAYDKDGRGVTEHVAADFRVGSEP